MKHAYNGPQAVVDVPALGLYGVRRGEPVDIDAPERVQRQLRRQGWQKVKPENSDDKNKNQEGDGE